MSQKIKNALISLSDKSKIERVLKVLQKYKINIISSGGTYKEIKKLGYNVLKYQNILSLVRCLMEE